MVIFNCSDHHRAFSDLIRQCSSTTTETLSDMDFEVRGKPQIVQKTSGECYTLHDPFNATALDFIRRCLDQLARGLHLVIVHTYENGYGFKKEEFFIGKDHKPVNPRKHYSGTSFTR